MGLIYNEYLSQNFLVYKLTVIYHGNVILNIHVKNYPNVLVYSARPEKKIAKSSLINLYYSFAYPYLIYCNHVWGNNYPTNLEKLYLVQKKLIRIITCSPYRAHTEPLCIVNRILNVTDINTYIIGIFMYDCMNENVPNSFQIFFQINRNIHDYDVRSADDIHVPYGRLDIRRFSIRITGANVWNTLPEHIKSTSSIHLFKRSLKNHLLDIRLQS